jgi:Tfp pilus assembly protein PilV
VEFLMAAFILAVGLLGIGTLQLATVRHAAGSTARMAAATLAANALETAVAEARVEGGDARELAVPESGPTVAWFGPDGRPAEGRPGFFVVTVTRSAPAAGGAREVRAAVAWEEGAPPVRRGLALSRIIAP